MKIICAYCNLECKRPSDSKFCGIQCTEDNRRKIGKEKFFNGEIVGRPYLKAHLVAIYGWKCMVCNNTEWEGQSIPLELDHIDGNAGNCMPDNVRNLCPNCHAQTPTHKARNKGNGRGSRGLPWY